MKRDILKAKNIYEQLSFMLGCSSTGCKWKLTRTDLIRKVPDLFFSTIDSIMRELGLDTNDLFLKRIVCEGLEYNKSFEDMLHGLRINEDLKED